MEGKKLQSKYRIEIATNRNKRSFVVLLNHSFLSFGGDVKCCVKFIIHLLNIDTTSSLEDGLSVLVEVQLGDNNVRSVDVDRNRVTVRLLLGNLLDLDGPLKSVNLRNLAFSALVGTSDNSDLVVLSNRDGSNLVLLSELLGERSRHENSSLRRGSIEVSLSGLSSG